MKSAFENRWVTWPLLVILMALAACSQGDDDDGASEAEGSDVSITSQAAENRPQALLTAQTSGVVLLNAAADEMPVDIGSEIDIEIDDRIRVESSGVGLIEFDDLDFEVFLSGDLALSRVQMQADRLTEVEVELIAGHLKVELDESSGTNVTVQAGDRRFTTLERGTEFAVCQAPNGGTCLNVVKGSVEWFSGRNRQTYSASKSTFAAPGQPPEAEICSNDAEFQTWLEAARTGETDLDLAGLVQTWSGNVCPGGIGEYAGSKVPSSLGMIRVSVEAPVIGTDDRALAPENYREPSTLEAPVDFYVNEQLVSNESFRTWLVWAAGDDPDKWRELAPDDWIRNAQDGAVTQATFPDGQRQSPVTGVSSRSAEQYCAFEDKVLPTEAQWEVAAVNGFFAYGQVQEWVTDWGEYGPGVGQGQRVLRGTNDILDPDPYYRLYLFDDADNAVARAQAGVRCAASEVRVDEAPEPTGALAYSDDFSVFDHDWPQVPGDGFDIGYHPPAFYHVESSREHRQVLVLSDADPLTGATIETDVLVRSTAGGSGTFRYGLAAGSAESGYLVFTVQPEKDGDRLLHNWCLESLPADHPLISSITQSGERFASYPLPEGTDRHQSEAPCKAGLANGRTEVTTFENTLRLTVGASSATVAIDGEQVSEVDVAVPAGNFGFFVETFHMPLAHIHYETLSATTP